MKKFMKQWGQAIGVGLAVSLIVVAGCGDDKSANNPGELGRVVLVMHDAIDNDFKEIWLTVESVTMIGDGDSTNTAILLSESVRLDFLALTSVSEVLATADVQSGRYSKIRLRVSDPEFVRNDDSVFTEPEVMLVANGHVDLNPQGLIEIVADSLHIITLDLDLDGSIQIIPTGNGRYILRPQIFIDGKDDMDPDNDDAVGTVIGHATIVSTDVASGDIVLSLPGSRGEMSIATNAQTEIEGANGLPLALNELLSGATVKVVGELDIVSGDFVATHIKLKS